MVGPTHSDNANRQYYLNMVIHLYLHDLIITSKTGKITKIITVSYIVIHIRSHNILEYNIIINNYASSAAAMMVFISFSSFKILNSMKINVSYRFDQTSYLNIAQAIKLLTKHIYNLKSKNKFRINLTNLIIILYNIIITTAVLRAVLTTRYIADGADLLLLLTVNNC